MKTRLPSTSRQIIRGVIAAAAAALCAPLLSAQQPTPTPPPASTAAPTPAPAATPAGYVAAFAVPANAPLADRQIKTATRLSQRLVVGETQLLQNFRGLYNEVWRNGDGLSPQQVCDALGAKASNLFIIAGTMQRALYDIDPAGIGALVSPPPGYTPTINADGTVTLAYTPPPTPTPTPSASPAPGTAAAPTAGASSPAPSPAR